MPEQMVQPLRIRVVTLHLIALLLGLAGTGLTLLQGRYGLAQPADMHVVILVACVPLLAAIAFAIGPRHGLENPAPFQPLRSLPVIGNLVAPVLLTALTLALVAVSGSFEHFAGFAMLLAANAGRNLRDLLHHLTNRR